MTDRTPLTTSTDTRPVAPPADEAPGAPRGLTRGLVWSVLAAEMRADAAASGDDRFIRADALVSPRRRVPYEAQPIELDRARIARAAAPDGDRTERAA